MREEIKFICVNNTTRVFRDGSTDKADQYLTVGKTYIGSYGSADDGNVFVLNTDLGGFPTGHQWFSGHRFKEVDVVRQEKLDKLGI